MHYPFLDTFPPRNYGALDFKGWKSLIFAGNFEWDHDGL
jgi:hypothetical protein